MPTAQRIEEGPSLRCRAAWPQTAKDFADLAKTKLTMPVLAIGGDNSNASTLFPQMKRLTNDVSVVGLKETGHCLMEERRGETMDAILKFLCCVPSFLDKQIPSQGNTSYRVLAENGAG